MSTFTIFFCGTGSNSFDFAHTNYHAGELVSTLARNHKGSEFVDWIIVDGPGSGNLQEAEKFVPAGNYSWLRGTMQGKGWEENVKHAVAILLGMTQVDRQSHTRKENKRLRKMGVGVETAPGRLWGTREVHTPLHARISPQALQAQKIKVLRKGEAIDRINLVGWSRGAVTCHMMANALAETEGFDRTPVNIFACDPVPGSGQFANDRIALRKNVQDYVAIFAADERSRGFSPVLPQLVESTRRFITTIPGRHATLVGNASVDGNSGFNDLFGPGQVTRDLAEKFLTRWNTPLSKRLSLSETQVLKLYDEMIGQRDQFTQMQNISYTYFTQKGERAVGRGDGTFTTFGSEGVLRKDPAFVNGHHRFLFSSRYPRLYKALFENERIDRNRLDMELFNLRMMYPKLFKYWGL